MLLGALAPDALEEGKAWFRDFAKKDPVDALIWTTLVASELFFRAEHGHNPKVRTLNDAYVYVTTNLSVGYCDIFAQTEAGKQIASFLMTFGPALAARALDDTRAEREAQEEELRAHRSRVEDTLTRIADMLEAQTPSGSANEAQDVLPPDGSSR
jgi:voltage-gated potassium channel